jgi:hypothetical protein
MATWGVLNVLKVSWKRTTIPFDPVPSDVRRRNQFSKLSGAKVGKGRLLSMPAKRSRSQRLSGTRMNQLESLEKREPQRWILSILPNNRFRNGKPLAV